MKKMFFIILILTAFIMYAVSQATVITRPANVEEVLFNIKTEACGDTPSREESFLQAESTDVRKLGEIERLCTTHATDVMYLSVVIPNSSENAKLQGSRILSTLNERAEYNLKTLLFLEIPDSWKTSDFSELKAGNMNKYIEEMFKLVSDAGMPQASFEGILIIPTPNMPLWEKKALEPASYGSYYNQVASTVNGVLPEVKLGVYFSSTTYEEAPYDYSEKDYRSLIPYTKDIKPELIQIIGIEGYPWLPDLKNAAAPQFNPEEFLGIPTLDELITIHNPEVVVFGTGTFAARDFSEEENILLVPSEKRLEILENIAKTVKRYSNQNRQVHIVLNMYTDNVKSIDWAYFGTRFSENPKHQEILVEAVKTLHEHNLGKVFRF